MKYKKSKLTDLYDKQNNLYLKFLTITNSFENNLNNLINNINPKNKKQC